MIQKLRTKFICISIGSVIFVLVLLMGLINVLNYRGMVRNADSLLALLSENDGRFPMPDNPEKFPGPPGFSPETPYETRFFVARLDEEDAVLSLDTGRIAAVDEETALDYVQAAWRKGKTRGFIGAYRYLRSENEDGSMLVFLDCHRIRNSCRNVLLVSAAVSSFGILLVFLLIFIFSGMIMKPVYESYEKQKRFITDAGHEIKTPLTIIDADIDVLEMEIGGNEWLADMQKQTKRLSGLTNELIYLARMEENKQNIQMIHVLFSDLVEETVQSFQALGIMMNKTFEEAIEPALMVCGDEKALRKLLSILIDNAIKYSDENGRISVNLEKSGRMVRLSVENTAEAVTKENISHMFERFYRADSSRNSQKGGYGIGLSIAEAIVRAHKGEIRASTKDGCSLNVTVLLPVRQ